MNSSAGVCNEAAFGPAVHGCRQDFDFTLAFEQYIFSVLPSTLFILAAPLRLAFLQRRENPQKVAGHGFKRVKLVGPNSPRSI